MHGSHSLVLCNAEPGEGSSGSSSRKALDKPIDSSPVLLGLGLWKDLDMLIESSPMLLGLSSALDKRIESVPLGLRPNALDKPSESSPDSGTPVLREHFDDCLVLIVFAGVALFVHLHFRVLIILQHGIIMLVRVVIAPAVDVWDKISAPYNNKHQ